MREAINRRQSHLERMRLAAERTTNAAIAKARCSASGAPIVYIDEHFDSMENYTFWSVNGVSGDGGTQSDRYYVYEQAVADACLLAAETGARLQK